MGKQRCQDCDGYQNQGHNYCRMCGFHLTAGFVQHVRVAVTYFTNEKFCGYCGRTRAACSC